MTTRPLMPHRVLVHRTDVRPLIEVVLLVDGAEVRCTYCGASQALPPDRPDVEILLFQERHFDCDPHLMDVQPFRAVGPGER